MKSRIREEIELPNPERIRPLRKKKYLKILKAVTIKQAVMKEKN